MEFTTKETEIELPRSDDPMEGDLDNIADGIMGLLEDDDPNSSGKVDPKPEEPREAEKAKGPDTKEPAEVEDDAQIYTIKWQGKEVEVSGKDLMELAQKGFDYTQKTQQLAAERDEIAPYMGLVNRIRTDPTLAQHIATYLTGNVSELKGKEEPSDDPVAQLKSEIRAEIMGELRKELSANVAPIARTQVLDRVRMQVQADPDYNEIQQQILDMVSSQPPALQKTLFMQLDQDPEAYLQTFAHFKKLKAESPPKEQPPKPKAVKRETRAPILETGGPAPSELDNKARAEKLSKMKAKALRSGDNLALADWLIASGSIDHLV